MASTNSTVDGMGFEEMGQVGSQPLSTWIAGSFTAEDYIATNTYFTTPGSVYGADGIFTGSVSDGQGQLRSVGIDNAATIYGYRIQAGSVKTGNSASGLITFKTPFSSTNWFITITPSTLTNPYLYQVTDGSGLVPCVSGVRATDGCWVYGGSVTVYDWIAVGR